MIEIVLFELDQTLPIALVEEKIIETTIVLFIGCTHMVHVYKMKLQ